MVSPEPGRQGPTSPQATWGAGLSKSAAAHGRRGRGGGAGSGGGEAAAPSLDSSYKHDRNRYAPRFGKSNAEGYTCGVFAVTRCRDLESGKALYEYVRLPCKGWHCDVCGPKRAAQLRRAIEQAVRDFGLTRFLTLTLDPQNIPPGEGDLVYYIRGKVWAKFRTYLKRKLPRPIRYIAILEFTKAGLPHLHVLVDQFIPQKWISSSWDALGGGRIVDIRYVDGPHRVARYLAKYLSKRVILSAPRGVQRWSCSRGIHLFAKRESTGEWKFPFRSFELLYWLAWGRCLIAEEVNSDGEVYRFTATDDVLEG